MEIIDAKANQLCNFEVQQFLKEQKSNMDLSEKESGKGKKKAKKKRNQAMATVTYETLAWLENSPTGLQAECHVKECIEKLNEASKAGAYKLTSKEQIQLINHRPSTAVEIQLLIEDSEDRLSEEQVEEIIDIVMESLPGGEQEEEEEENGEQEGENNEENGGEGEGLEETTEPV